MRELALSLDLDRDRSSLPNKARRKKTPPGPGTAAMKPSPSSSLYNQDLDDVGGIVSVGMDVDDADPLDFMGEMERPPLDGDFFNSFEDDFDDADIN